MMHIRPLTHDYLLAKFIYEPETGLFFRRVIRLGGARGVDRAGSVFDRGYIKIRIFKRAYFAHRLAWFYMTGQWPAGEIDHKNRITGDNRWDNLREASHAQNHANEKCRSDNVIGLKGVSLHKPTQQWQARICKHGQRIRLGLFDTAEEAYAAYCRAAPLVFGDYARLS